MTDGEGSRGRIAPAEEYRWVVALLAIGILARTVRWMLEFPFGGDESVLALSLVERGYKDLLGPLDNAQVAPIAFLVGEVALHRSFGPSEQSLRALPYLASVAGLLCFALLARSASNLVPRLRGGALLGLGFFSVSYYLVRYGAEFKPYSGDAFATALLSWLAVSWIGATLRGQTNARRWMWALASVVAPALLFSYPAALVAAAIGLVCAPLAWRRRGNGTMPGVVAYGVMAALGFGGSYLLIGRIQRAAANLGIDYMETYWEKAFPPLHAPQLLAWLLDTHSGLMFAYPTGGPRGGSTLTLLFFVLGAWALRQRREESTAPGASTWLLAVLLGPFLVALGAAFLRLYPYGGHIRLTLYLGPEICLLAGIGVATTVDRIRTPARAILCTRLILAALVVMGTVGIGLDVLRPYRVEREEAMRAIVGRAAASLPSGGLLASLSSLDEIRHSNALGATFEWDLRRLWSGGLAFGGSLEVSQLVPGRRIVGLLYSTKDTLADDAPIDAWLGSNADLVRQRAVTTECLTNDCREAFRVVELDVIRPAPR